MRVSSDTTTSMIIQILHESNSFFGLVGEAEYYQPLLERVKAISETTSLQQQQQEKNKRTDVILTGHSLGGGLSRIVAALAHLPSVSFAPPGIALSHRKFSILKEKEDHSDDDSGNPNPFPHDRHRKIRGMTDLHDQSMAVITDFDM
jgi:cephalosporin-C deacetylase-like acetyl esterase